MPLINVFKRFVLLPPPPSSFSLTPLSCGTVKPIHHMYQEGVNNQNAGQNKGGSEKRGKEGESR